MHVFQASYKNKSRSHIIFLCLISSTVGMHTHPSVVSLFEVELLQCHALTCMDASWELQLLYWYNGSFIVGACVHGVYYNKCSVAIWSSSKNQWPSRKFSSSSWPLSFQMFGNKLYWYYLNRGGGGKCYKWMGIAMYITVIVQGLVLLWMGL